jgi:hypothetical protein
VKLARTTLLVLATSCGGLYSALWDQDLSGGHRLYAEENYAQMAIVSADADLSRGESDVPACVVRVASDARHILAAQHPTVGDHPFEIDFKTTQYWVIQLEPGVRSLVLGPFDADEFARKRVELGVDPALALHRVAYLE